jgi:hypothetical protein
MKHPDFRDAFFYISTMRNLLFTITCFLVSISFVTAQANTQSIKKFSISSPVYRGIINEVTLPGFDSATQKIISDDGNVYFSEKLQQYILQTNLPDSAVFYKINKATAETIAVCTVKVLSLSDDEKGPPHISFGDIDNKLVTVELLKEQKNISISPGFTFVSGTFYFTGPNFKNIFVRSLTDSNLTPLFSIIDSCVTGAVIAGDNIVVKTKRGKLMHAVMPVIKVGSVFRPINFNIPELQIGNIRPGRASADFFKRQKNIIVPKGYQLIKCDVYFTGAGFRDVAVANLYGSSIGGLSSLISKCQPGTAVIFSKIILKNSAGKLIPIPDQSFALY